MAQGPQRRKAASQELPPFSAATVAQLDQLAAQFSEADARADQADRAPHQPRRERRSNTGCARSWRTTRKPQTSSSSSTSPAPRKTSTTCRHALMLKSSRDAVMLPALDALIARMREHRAPARRAADAVPHPRPDRHAQHAGQGNGQRGASPAACARAHRRIAILGKINGAVGNYNAHLSAYPDVDWEEFRATLRRERAAWRSTPTPSRSSRTTTWPNCSTPSRAPTPS